MLKKTREELEAFGDFSALIGFFVGKYQFDVLEDLPGNGSIVRTSIKRRSQVPQGKRANGFVYTPKFRIWAVSCSIHFGPVDYS